MIDKNPIILKLIQYYPDKFNKRREQLRYETYEHLVATGFFTGTYEEYKERTKLGLIGPTQTF